MENIELTVSMPKVIYPLMCDKDGQTKRRERRKSAKKDKSRWHVVKPNK